MQNSVICTRMTSLYGFQPSSVFFLHPQQRLYDQTYKTLWVPVLICGFCIQNSDFWNRITNLYESQTSPVVLCRQYSVISSRITCLYGSQTLSVIFACKTATFGAELQVFMGPRHDLSFCAYKTAWLASELLVSMSPISHVWFLDPKNRLFERNNKSLRVPDITCRCVHENSVIRTRISSLYVSQTSSVVLSTHNCVLNTIIKRLYWFQASPVVLCMQNSDFRTRITSLCGSKTQPVVFVCKTANSGPE